MNTMPVYLIFFLFASSVFAESRTRIQHVVVIDCSPKSDEKAESARLKRCNDFVGVLKNCGVEVVADASKRQHEVAAEFVMGNGLAPGGLVAICDAKERVKKKGAVDQVETALGELFCSEATFNAADKIPTDGVLEVRELKRFLSEAIGARSRARSGGTGANEDDPCLPLALLSQESPQLKLPARGLRSAWRTWESAAPVPHAQSDGQGRSPERGFTVVEEPNPVVIEPVHD